MEAASTSETSVNFYHTALPSEDCHLDIRHPENLKSHINLVDYIIPHSISLKPILILPFRLTINNISDETKTIYRQYKYRLLFSVLYEVQYDWLYNLTCKMFQTHRILQLFSY
jgi:hypothetical protein